MIHRALIFFFLCAALTPSAVALAEEAAAIAPEQMLCEQARACSAAGDWVKAKQIYRGILTEYPASPFLPSVRKELGNTNISFIRSALIVPQSMLYSVQPADSIDKLARKFGTTVELIKASNNISSPLIRPGQSLRIWTEPFSIVIDKSQNTLTLQTDQEIIKEYPVATGAGNITPSGEFTIASKLKDPVWFRKGTVILPENPLNALGTRWLGLTKPQYGIHGTIQPALIGQQVSHGCVRMLNQDVEELYDIVPIGTEVFITD
jgi:lipoprotein-anchoring transpeptidase ErfK/SrfK